MPEWTVQRIRRFADPRNGSEYNYTSYKGRYFILADNELWETFSLKDKTVLCNINGILDKTGAISSVIGKKIAMNARTIHTSPYDIYEKPSANSYVSIVNTLIFPVDFVKRYGLRTADFIDVVILGVSNKDDTETLDEEIYPDRWVKGIREIEPSGSSSHQTTQSYEPLIRQHTSNPFYVDLINELNRAFAYEMYRSTSILIRTLFENLLIDLFRTKYGKQTIGIYYDTAHGHFNEFSVLLKNLREKRADFNPFTSGLDDAFFEFLNKYRENGNSNAHALEAYIDKNTLEADRKRLNHCITVLSNATSSIKDADR